MNNRSVAVILPTIPGREKWLQESLDSLTRQEGVEGTVFLCANGTGGDSLKHALAFLDRCDNVGMHYLAFEENSADNIGRAQQRAKASGCEYIVDWTDDDIMSPLGLYTKVRMLEERPEAVFACNPAQVIDADGEIKPNAYKGFMPSDTVTLQDLVVTCPIIMGSVVWRAEHYNPKVVQPTRIGGEWPKYAEALYKSGSYGLYCPLALTFLRLHDQSDTVVHGFQNGEFVEMHMGMWQWIVAEYGVQPTKEQWDDMGNTLLGLLSFDINRFTNSDSFKHKFQQFLEFRRKYETPRSESIM